MLDFNGRMGGRFIVGIIRARVGILKLMVMILKAGMLLLQFLWQDREKRQVMNINSIRALLVLPRNSEMYLPEIIPLPSGKLTAAELPLQRYLYSLVILDISPQILMVIMTPGIL